MQNKALYVTIKPQIEDDARNKNDIRQKPIRTRGETPWEKVRLLMGTEMNRKRPARNGQKLL
ncbi:MAG TPA: hypothetical protein DEV98_01135 [Clostridiales bacterium]|nr:hypothetical protein [Clostridiales bacterium]